MVTWWLILTAWTSIVGWIILRNKKNKEAMPSHLGQQIPGPFNWPLLGHLPHLSTNLTENSAMATKYADKYGPILHFRLGSQDVVFMTDYHQIKRAYSSEEFSFRPKVLFYETISSGFQGIAFSDGPLWREHRRFGLRQLRELGLGRSKIESSIQLEMEALSQEITRRSADGKAVDLNEVFNFASANVIWSMVTGSRLEYSDPRFLELTTLLKQGFDDLGSISYMTTLAFPWAVNLVPEKFNCYRHLKNLYNYLNTEFTKMIKEHRLSLNPENPRDYIDYFLIEQKKKSDGLKESTFTDPQLVTTVTDFLGAGQETTATTLSWAVLLILKHPDVEKKLVEEIGRVIGKDRPPCLEDQKSMLYTLAVIQKVQRFADIVPFSVAHSNADDVNFDGFHIPKGSFILACAGNSHRNSKFWEKPDDFYPEHFLLPDGQLRQNVEGFLPFSIGKRTCLGERLAKAELFLAITNLFQKFTFKFDPSCPEPPLSANPKSLALRWASPYKVVVNGRRNNQA